MRYKTVIEPQEIPHAGERYNDLPENFREITEKEFAQSRFFNYSPQFIGFKQCVFPLNGDKPTFHSLQLYHFHDHTGIALVHDYWKGKVHYFKYGCEHKMDGTFTEDELKNIPRGNCLHSYKCSNCGYIETVDSSD